MKIVLQEEQITYVTTTYQIDEETVPEDRMKEVLDILDKEEHTEGDINTIANFCDEFNSDVSMKSSDDMEYIPVGVEDSEVETQRWIDYLENKEAMEEEYNNEEEGK